MGSSDGSVRVHVDDEGHLCAAIVSDGSSIDIEDAGDFAILVIAGAKYLVRKRAGAESASPSVAVLLTRCERELVAAIARLERDAKAGLDKGYAGISYDAAAEARAAMERTLVALRREVLGSLSPEQPAIDHARAREEDPCGT